MFCITACGSGSDKPENGSGTSAFDDDVKFLKKYGEVIELTDSQLKSRIAVMPALQARVMTSSAGPPENLSYGWINKTFFESGDTSVHMNAFGGEERFWLGPEGGQFSIFFEKGSAFTFENWRTPRVIDLDAYELISKTAHMATFSKTTELVNYSGTRFKIKISRAIKVLEQGDAYQYLRAQADTTLQCVAYQTINSIENLADVAWSKNTGLLSIWLLGMFKPSPGLTTVVPFQEGPVSTLGPIVSDDYFGTVPANRLHVANGAIFFRGDGEFRSKIGLSPRRAKDVMGSYDSATETLTIVKYSKGNPTDIYVNSKWELQSEPFKGDVVNAYNDGPPGPGLKPMGPFYELESSSHTRELQPGESIIHTQATFHFKGKKESINQLSKEVLGVSIADIISAFK